MTVNHLLAYFQNAIQLVFRICCSVVPRIFFFTSKLVFQEHILPNNRAGGIQTTNHNTQQLEDLSTDVFGLHKNMKRLREREIQRSKMK